MYIYVYISDPTSRILVVSVCKMTSAGLVGREIVTVYLYLAIGRSDVSQTVLLSKNSNLNHL